MATPISYREITIDYDRRTGKIEVTPDPASLYWLTGPADARWRRKDGTGVAWEFDIEFEGEEVPLATLTSTTGPTGYEVLGTDNTRKRGSFKYTVIIREGTMELDRLDPGLDNYPEP